MSALGNMAALQAALLKKPKAAAKPKAAVKHSPDYPVYIGMALVSACYAAMWLAGWIAS